MWWEASNRRESLLANFACDSIPGLARDDEQQIADYYKELGTTLPPYIVIDPAKDRPKIKEILHKGFLSKLYLDFFSGDETGMSSPGGSPYHDSIVFYDWQEKYRKETLETVAGWGWSIGSESLEQQVRLHVVDFAAHELGHMTTGQVIKNLVLEHDGTKKGVTLTEKAIYDFEPLRTELDMPKYTDMVREGDYYSGPLIGEGSAVVHSVAVLEQILGVDQSDYSAAAKTYLYSDCTNPEGNKSSIGVGGLHSGQAYVGLEGLNAQYPELKPVIKQAELGRIGETEFLTKLRSLLPHEIRVLLFAPSSAAWDEICARFPDPKEK